MGLDKAFRDILRREVPGAFRRDKLDPGQVFDAVMCDLGQVVFGLPPGDQSRGAVADSCMRHMLDLAEMCWASQAGRLQQPKIPVIYALFDSSKLVTKAKSLCHEKRYATGKKPPKDADSLVLMYTKKMPVRCDWYEFLAYAPARRAIMEYLEQDLAAMYLDPAKAVLIIDGTGTNGPSGKGEAEIKTQVFAIQHIGHGVLIDSADTDIFAMWLLTGSLVFDQIGLPTKNVCMCSRVGNGTRHYRHSELVAGLVAKRGITPEEASALLEKQGIYSHMKVEDMPDDVPTKSTTTTEYADLNMIYHMINKKNSHLGKSLAFLGFLCGSDLLPGRVAPPQLCPPGKTLHARSLPNIGAKKAISFYLDNAKEIGDLVRGDRVGPTMMFYKFDIKAFWKYVRLLFWAKLGKSNWAKEAKDVTNGVPTYAVLRKISTKEGDDKKEKSYSRVVPTEKAMLVSFANCRFATCYYGLNDQGDCLDSGATSTLSLHGWYMDSSKRVDILPDWDDQSNGDSPEEMPLHDQKRLAIHANTPIAYYECNPPPLTVKRADDIVKSSKVVRKRANKICAEAVKDIAEFDAMFDEELTKEEKEVRGDSIALDDDYSADEKADKPQKVAEDDDFVIHDEDDADLEAAKKLSKAEADKLLKDKEEAEFKAAKELSIESKKDESLKELSKTEVIEEEKSIQKDMMAFDDAVCANEKAAPVLLSTGVPVAPTFVSFEKVPEEKKKQHHHHHGHHRSEKKNKDEEPEEPPSKKRKVDVPPPTDSGQWMTRAKRKPAAKK
jgi:hypothetical protein